MDAKVEVRNGALVTARHKRPQRDALGLCKTADDGQLHGAMDVLRMPRVRPCTRPPAASHTSHPPAADTPRCEDNPTWVAPPEAALIAARRREAAQCCHRVVASARS